MNINNLNLPEKVKKFYTDAGIVDLYPPQREAVGKGLLDGENIVAAIPTASGKTLLAELCMLKSIEEGGKCLYIVPLKALASEKYSRFREFESLGIKVGIATGDLDSREEWLGNNNIIIATSEKADSLLRNETSWMKEINTVVADEVHLLNSVNRGPTLEITLAKLIHLNPVSQIIALSATIGNPEDIAGWLGARLVVSEWRPTDLYEGVLLDGVLHIGNIKKDIPEESRDDAINLVIDTVKDKGQCLVFESSRRNCMGFAKKAGKWVSNIVDEHDAIQLKSLSQEIGEAGETEIADVLSRCVVQGVAFHHAGLNSEHRRMVEDGFRKNLIKMISSTPTLAAGLNLPARRVIIRSYKRYDPNFGMKPIPVLEYKQMAGRAGRPHLDPYGESVLIARSHDEFMDIMDNYVNADPEDIWSKLGTENALRTHVLSTIVNGFAYTYRGLMDFVKMTFFAYQKEASDLHDVIEECVRFLIDNEMIISDSTDILPDSAFKPTSTGKLISMLYIDPLSGSLIMDGVRKAGYFEDITMMHLICSTPDMKNLYMRSSDYENVNMYVLQNKDKFISMPSPFKMIEYEWFLGEVKTALLLLDWINEVPADDICKKYGIGEGDIRMFSETAVWLMHATSRLSGLLKLSEAAEKSKELEKRLSYGINPELVNIVALKGIGRVRARKIYENGYMSIDDLKKADPLKLSKILGSKISQKIFKQLDIDVDISEIKEKGSDTVPGPERSQKTISDFT